ncbi:MAG TPA: D-alanyl-D-alanine carboxypeptidase/D-alanyl-D-alanine-endopeptidase [Intrasporangium sp.]|nr:D-alanyl-D-alanine carboxypeptidase/D-alanyl-D-alanine-endopeptidase [Intrasporangium sp.]
MKRAVRRSVVIGSALAVLVGYAALDATDLAPGFLTTRPLPPPPPTATSGTRTLPLVPQPTPSTSVAMPLSSLAEDGAAASAAGVQEKLADVLALPALSAASLVVRDGQTGAVLLDERGATPQVPASTTKLLSAAAIGQVFGPDDVLTTKVVGGSSRGSIILVAGGDSLLAPDRGDPGAVVGRAGLGDLAGQVADALRKSGTTKVTVSVDLSYAPGPLLAPTWSGSFRPDGITGAVAMLGRADQRAVPGRPGPADPVTSTLDAFVAQLGQHGITATSGGGRQALAPLDATVLGSVESAPVLDQLALALTESDNALIEVLARQAAFRSGAPTTFPDVGAWAVKRVASLGLDVHGVTLSDASGLSRENRVTALLLTDLLAKAYDGQHAQLRLAVEGMPIAGLTGTLEDRYLSGTSHAAAGRVRAKTGTLTGANALAGSVVDDNGRLLVFAGLVPQAGRQDARAALDSFVTALASCGCRG